MFEVKSKPPFQHNLVAFAVAEDLGYNVDELIRLGALGKLNIFILPDDWLMESFFKGELEEDDDYGQPIERDYEKGSNQPFLVSKPLPLLQETIMQYRANRSATVRKFAAPDTPNGPEGFTEQYRLCAVAADGKPQQDVMLSHAVLLVRAGDLDKVNPSTKPAKDLSDVARKTLLKQIGVLAWLLSSKTPKYKNGEKPNASQIAKDVQLLLDDNSGMLSSAGLGDSTIRENIKAGVNLLIEK